MNQPTASPVTLQERSDILDVLRGFALLGIFLDNIFGFTGYAYATPKMRETLSTAPGDQILQFTEFAFIHGKFYSLFSLLFGIGFSVILVNSERKGINPLKIFYRRLFTLLLIGGVHLVLIWEGDILFLYAVLGLLLPLFRNCSNRSLLIWSVALIASPILIDIVKVIFQFRTGGFLEGLALQSDERTGIPLDDGFRLYLFNNGSGWQEWRNWQASGYLYRMAYILESNRIPKVLGLFILGFYIGRRLIYVQLEENRTLLKKLRLWGFIIGVPCGLGLAYFEQYGKPIPDAQGLFQTVFYAVGVVPLSLAYASTLCLWWLKYKKSSALNWLKAPGRMALTNYLTQTIIGVIIFYGVGFGFGGNLGPTKFIPIALLVYLLQVLLSNWWFKYFNYGPVEWIWRQVTYMKRLPIRK